MGPGSGTGACAVSAGFACSAPGAFGGGPFGSGGVSGSGAAAFGAASKATAAAGFTASPALFCAGTAVAPVAAAAFKLRRPRFRLARILRHRQRHRASEASRDAYAKHCPCNHTDPLLPLARYAIRKMLGFFFP